MKGYVLPARSLPRLLYILILFVPLTGCAVKFTDDFDIATFEETIRVSKQVDHFYAELLEAPANNRPYKKYSARYINIETELRSLKLRNTARPLNEESSKIAENILTLWKKYKKRHKEENTYKDTLARLEQARLTRMFTSALKAEKAKNDISTNNK